MHDIHRLEFTCDKMWNNLRRIREFLVRKTVGSTREVWGRICSGSPREDTRCPAHAGRPHCAPQDRFTCKARPRACDSTNKNLINISTLEENQPTYPPSHPNIMTPRKRPRTNSSNPPTVAPIPKSQKPPGELLSSEEKRANHIASVLRPPDDGRLTNRNKSGDRQSGTGSTG
jgi:hypothetical protein